MVERSAVAAPRSRAAPCAISGAAPRNRVWAPKSNVNMSTSKKMRKTADATVIALKKLPRVLREDLVKRLKRVALEEDKKLYEVMEDAVVEYLARHEDSPVGAQAPE